MASVEKAEIKIAVANDIGASIEDSKEAAQREIEQAKGAVGAFVQAEKACLGLAERVRVEFDEGKLEGFGLEHVARIKEYLLRAANAQQALRVNADKLFVAASGKVSALEQAIGLVERYRRTEQLKISEARVEAVAQGTIVEMHPIANVRPGMTIKQRRLLEAAQADAATATPVASGDVKRRGRPRKK